MSISHKLILKLLQVSSLNTITFVYKYECWLQKNIFWFEFGGRQSGVMTTNIYAVPLRTARGQSLSAPQSLSCRWLKFLQCETVCVCVRVRVSCGGRGKETTSRLFCFWLSSALPLSVWGKSSSRYGSDYGIRNRQHWLIICLNSMLFTLAIIRSSSFCSFQHKKQHTLLHKLNGVVMLLSFFVCRVLLFPYLYFAYSRSVPQLLPEYRRSCCVSTPASALCLAGTPPSRCTRCPWWPRGSVTWGPRCSGPCSSTGSRWSADELCARPSQHDPAHRALKVARRRNKTDKRTRALCSVQTVAAWSRRHCNVTVVNLEM